MPTTVAEPVEVAVGVVRDNLGRVLVARRQPGQHLAGLWEFPGGKFEPGETPEQALKRELHEELGITVTAAKPWKIIAHAYPECSVRLHFWQVTGFSGQATGLLGQQLAWVAPDRLDDYPLPPPSLPMVNALRLPDIYAIIDDTVGNDRLADVEQYLLQGYRLLQLRLKNSTPETAGKISSRARAMADNWNAKLLINSKTPGSTNRLGHGLHLTAQDLYALNRRPEGFDWLAASCHNAEELARAGRLGLDFVVLGPVNASLSHPGQSGMGWPAFEALARACPLPVYALGGLTLTDLDQAIASGAQGIAAIRGLRRG